MTDDDDTRPDAEDLARRCALVRRPLAPWAVEELLMRLDNARRERDTDGTEEVTR